MALCKILFLNGKQTFESFEWDDLDQSDTFLHAFDQNTNFENDNLAKHIRHNLIEKRYGSLASILKLQ